MGKLPKLPPLALLYLTETPPYESGAVSYRARQLLQVCGPEGIVFAFPAAQGEWEGARALPLKTASAYALFRNFDRIVFGCGPVPHLASLCRLANKRLEVDAYNLPHLETNEVARAYPSRANRWLARANTGMTRSLLGLADQIWCSNPMQAEYVHTLNPTAAIDFWPLQIPEPPETSDTPPPGAGLKESAAQQSLFVIGGGCWPWFDLDTVWKAVHIAISDLPFLKLVCFPGASAFPLHAKRIEAVIESDPLLRRHVLPIRSWIPRSQVSWLFQRATAGLSVHQDSEESRHAHRTRILDYLQHALPTIGTAGDYVSGVAAQRGAALLSGPGDAAALARDMVRISRDGNLRHRMSLASEAVRLELQPPSRIPIQRKDKSVRHSAMSFCKGFSWLMLRSLGAQQIQA